jgi:hypothetical protein
MIQHRYSFVIMPMMDVRHMSMLMLGLWMLMLMGVRFLVITMRVELIIVTMNMLMQDRHMDVKMGVFFICQH